MAGNSTPGFVGGEKPTAGQWNGYFEGKQDYSVSLDALIAAMGGTNELVVFKEAINLDEVDNTPDAMKPVSGPTALALAARADLNLDNVNPGNARVSLGLGNIKTLFDYGCKCDGVTDDTVAFASAIAAGAILYHVSGSMVLSAINVTVPVIVFPKASFKNSGLLAFKSGGGRFDAGIPLQYFTGAGAVTFDGGTLRSGIDPRWFGMVVTDQGTVQTPAQATVNVAAIRAAIAAGLVASTQNAPAEINMRWAGEVYLNDTIVFAYNYLGMVGINEDTTTFAITHSKPAFQFGSTPSTQFDAIFVERLTIRHADPTSGLPAGPGVTQSTFESAGFLTQNTTLSTTTTPPTLAVLQTMSIGFLEYGVANFRRQNIRIKDFAIGIYSAFCTGTHGSQVVIIYNTAGVTNELRFVWYADGRGVGTSGTSMNGDTQGSHVWCNRGTYTGTEIGFVGDGRTYTSASGTTGLQGDIKDMWPNRFHPGTADYGVIMVGGACTDIKFHEPIFDTIRHLSMLLVGLPAGGSLRVVNGHFNGGATSLEAHVKIYNCNAAIDINGEFDGGQAFATASMIEVEGTSSGVTASGSLVNCHLGVDAQSGTTGCIFGPFTTASYPSQGPLAVVYLEAGATNNAVMQIANSATVSGAVVRSAGNNNRIFTPVQGASGSSSALVDTSGSTGCTVI